MYAGLSALLVDVAVVIVTVVVVVVSQANYSVLLQQSFIDAYSKPRRLLGTHF